MVPAIVQKGHMGNEYGSDGAYAEGLGVLEAALSKEKPDDRCRRKLHRCAILSNYKSTSNLADIAEVWRSGSGIASGCSTRAT